MANKLAWPFQLTTDGRLATVDADSIEHVAQCVHLGIRTRRGSRTLAPDVGVDDPTFVGAQTEDLAADIAEWEPRAAVAVEVTDDGADQTRRITVALRDELTAPEVS